MRSRFGLEVSGIVAIVVVCAEVAVAQQDLTGRSIAQSLSQSASQIDAVRELVLAEASESDSAPSVKKSAANLDARKKRYLKQHATLSKEDYDSLFSGPCDQRNTRDCFLLAALGAIPLAHREALFRTSIKPDEEGCVVTFPLGVSKPKASIRVRRQDLDPQVVVAAGRQITYMPVNTTDGWKALEAAYILATYGRDPNGQVNREAAADGSPVTVLERIMRTKPSRRIVITADMNALAQNPKSVSLATAALDSFDPERHMLTLGSLVVASRDYFIDNVRFRPKHAYAAPLVDPQNQQVMLINPHDSTKPLVISYSTLFRAFRVLRRLEFDVDNTYR